jgi:translation initiation factor IF-2
MSPSSAQRLVALQDLAILDTPPEAIFDDIVQITAALCDVPIALVSLENLWLPRTTSSL